jgi:pimeloyl-ACP methyl ester carboxylesterase
MSVAERIHTVRDTTVRLYRDGGGEPFVFFHGAAGLPGWIPFFEKLAKKFEVFVPEHPGFGDSDLPPWIRNVGDMALYYLDFLDDLGFQRVHLAGHSLGGWIAAELAVRNCSRVIDLTLIAPAGIRIKGVPSGDNFIWSPEELTRNLFYDSLLAEQRLAQTPSEQESERELKNRYMAARLGWEPRWFNPALERWLHRINVPAYVLWGANDKLLPSAYAELWGERLPDAKVDIIDQCGHLPQVEKADIAVRKILGFVNGR